MSSFIFSLQSQSKRRASVQSAERGVLMADRGAVACNDSCGCPHPCTGGAPCRCAALAAGGGAEGKKCMSGNNCGCKTCGCGPPAAAATAAEKERFYCRCAPVCTCTTCGA
ncbi:hypothetical protein BT93_L5164 [Corymbia citriodora subsp. variegata]|uniref:Metallothionein n=1 Tax=Corymbia citriodora subsp. variegata TaxID=360336 RepID=A0A8T0CV64_CORYI|nr:hypothetical protein BT93_L5164 [Corymbia citriodora subsp. variegata]